MNSNHQTIEVVNPNKIRGRSLTTGETERLQQANALRILELRIWDEQMITETSTV